MVDVSNKWRSNSEHKKSRGMKEFNNRFTIWHNRNLASIPECEFHEHVTIAFVFIILVLPKRRSFLVSEMLRLKPSPENLLSKLWVILVFSRNCRKGGYPKLRQNYCSLITLPLDTIYSAVKVVIISKWIISYKATSSLPHPPQKIFQLQNAKHPQNKVSCQ